MTILLGWNDTTFDPITEENVVYTYLKNAIKKLGVGKIVYVGDEKKYPALEVDTLQEFLDVMSEVQVPFYIRENWYKDEGFSSCTNIIVFE